MHRCFAPPERWQGKHVVLAQDEAHHLLHVLRARQGDLVQVFDGVGRSATARIEATGWAWPGRSARRRMVTGQELSLTILEQQHSPRTSLSITLLQAIPKGTKMDFIVEKATELGTARIIPVECQRVVPRRKEGQVEARLLRWRRIAIQAATQCGLNWLPEVCAPVSFSQAVESCRHFDLCVFGSLHKRAIPLKTVLKNLRSAAPRNVALMIGPEGDFSPDEVEQAVAGGVQPVSFGPLVMRVETAAIFGLAVIAYELS